MVGKKNHLIKKKWLKKVAKRVETNSNLYKNQLLLCENKLNKKGFFGVF